jgi:hypothetical protein
MPARERRVLAHCVNEAALKLQEEVLTYSFREIARFRTEIGEAVISVMEAGLARWEQLLAEHASHEQS